VSFARGLYQRFRHLIHEFAKFGVVGGIAFIVTEVVFNLLFHSGLGTFLANAIATLIAAVVSFAGNRYWTFRHRERTGMTRESVLFFVLNGIGVLIQQACIEVARLASGRHDTLTVNVAFLVGVALATLFRWWSYRKWVWLAPQSPQSPQSAAPPSPPSPQTPLSAAPQLAAPAEVAPAVQPRRAAGRHAAGRGEPRGSGLSAPRPYQPVRADRPVNGLAPDPVQHRP
jgi:putative flippase GtrA